MSNTQSRPTFALHDGDIVHAHGCRLRLFAKRYVPTSYRMPVDMSGCAFRTEYLGPSSPDRDPIAEHGSYYGGALVGGSWVIQGNAWTKWEVEV